MTRQLDPTILRFFTISRHISPASEMCLCKFHIKTSIFCDDGTHRARRRCLRFGSSPGTPQIPTVIHNSPHSSTIPHYVPHAFSKASISRSCISASAFSAIPRQPETYSKSSHIPYVPNPILLCVFHCGEVMPEPSSAPQFPLFPILFFLFTHMSMSCPIF